MEAGPTRSSALGNLKKKLDKGTLPAVPSPAPSAPPVVKTEDKYSREHQRILDGLDDIMKYLVTIEAKVSRIEQRLAGQGQNIPTVISRGGPQELNATMPSWSDIK